MNYLSANFALPFRKGCSGTANRFKFEAFLRHEQKHFHKDCKAEWEKRNVAATNKTAPEVSAWVAKLSHTFRDELCTKVIAENWLSTEDVAADKYGRLLEAFEQAKAKEWLSYRNRYGLILLMLFIQIKSLLTRRLNSKI